MKQLFEVGGEHFENKMKAKAHRNQNGGHVSIGPDHKDYERPAKCHEGSKGHRQGQGPGDGYKKRRR